MNGIAVEEVSRVGGLVKAMSDVLYQVTIDNRRRHLDTPTERGAERSTALKNRAADPKAVIFFNLASIWSSRDMDGSTMAA